MSITYCKEKGQFLLNTAHSSYVMEIYDGCLAHVYWGSKVSAVPSLDTLIPYMSDSLSAYDLPERIMHSTDALPQEYPTHGSADLRAPAFRARQSSGDAVTRFRYESHRIYSGKPILDGLPATYGEECETLEITLIDKFTGLTVLLSYTIFYEQDVLTRSAKIENRGQLPCTLEQAMSCSLDFTEMDFQVIHLHGAWGRERHIERLPICHGNLRFGSTRGASSHAENPFLALVSPETTETAGDAYGLCLVYSGNFLAEVSADQYNFTRVTVGIHPFDFKWELLPGSSFQTPEVIMVHSDKGLGEMSRRFHRIIRKNLCRGKFRDEDRPVLINNWEGTYFDFDESKILNLATTAKKIGVDMMVLDDGWFGRRDDDRSSLGDWTENRKKLPNGLKGLAKKINDLGMKFGLWFEPEMVSPDSDLYRAHPDWCIHVDGRSRTEGRHQLILDLSRKEVCDYIIEAVSKILRECSISYVKWDMNRNMTEPPYAGFYHQYILGLYYILETITSSFPDVLFEGCSSGGGRFDAGMLYYMPQTWTSDDTDGVERLRIQEGTGLVYPLSTMGAHVSAVPNHQVGRITPLSFRSKVAMMGRYGLELDLNKLDTSDLDILKEEIATYKAYQQIIHTGDYYRLASVFRGSYGAYQIISEDKNTVLLFFYNITGLPCHMPGRIYLQGLEQDSLYEDESGLTLPGSTLMHMGIAVDLRKDMSECMHIWRKKS